MFKNASFLHPDELNEQKWNVSRAFHHLIPIWFWCNDSALNWMKARPHGEKTVRKNWSGFGRLGTLHDRVYETHTQNGSEWNWWQCSVTSPLRHIYLYTLRFVLTLHGSKNSKLLRSYKIAYKRQKKTVVCKNKSHTYSVNIIFSIIQKLTFVDTRDS